MDYHPIQGGVRILLVTKCYRNRRLVPTRWRDSDCNVSCYLHSACGHQPAQGHITLGVLNAHSNRDRFVYSMIVALFSFIIVSIVSLFVPFLIINRSVLYHVI